MTRSIKYRQIDWVIEQYFFCRECQTFHYSGERLFILHDDLRIGEIDTLEFFEEEAIGMKFTVRFEMKNAEGSTVEVFDEEVENPDVTNREEALQLAEKMTSYIPLDDGMTLKVLDIIIPEPEAPMTPKQIVERAKENAKKETFKAQSAQVDLFGGAFSSPLPDFSTVEQGDDKHTVVAESSASLVKPDSQNVLFPEFGKEPQPVPQASQTGSSNTGYVPPIITEVGKEYSTIITPTGNPVTEGVATPVKSGYPSTTKPFVQRETQEEFEARAKPVVDNIVNLAETMLDSKMWSPEQCLQRAIKELHEGESAAWRECDGLIVIAINRKPGKYTLSYMQSGLSSTEAILACEMAQEKFKDEYRDANR